MIYFFKKTLSITFCKNWTSQAKSCEDECCKTIRNAWEWDSKCPVLLKAVT